MKRKSLLEVVQLTPRDQETLGLPASMRRILPQAQALKQHGVPIKPRENKWAREQDPERLTRTFEFKDTRVLKEFVAQLLDLQESLHHQAVVTIDGRRVLVEVWTQSVDAVTEIDIDFARQVDQIALDVPFHFGAL